MPMEQSNPRGQSHRESLAWDAGQLVSDAWQKYQDSADVIEREIAQLHQTLENTRQSYNRALEERNEMHKMLVSAEGRLGEVQKVVQRYTNVQEPVVASDGYTYERSVIQQYLEECGTSDTKAYSQLTKEVLTDTLLPNQSLKKLVELLKTVKPQEVQEMSEKQPLPPIDVEVERRPAAPAAPSAPAIHASDLEAGFQQAPEKREPRGKKERHDRHDREERPERQERQERPERQERGERGERQERPPRGERAERGERGDRDHKNERRERRDDRREDREEKEKKHADPEKKQAPTSFAAALLAPGNKKPASSAAKSEKRDTKQVGGAKNAPRKK